MKKLVEVSQHACGHLYVKNLGKYMNRVEIHQLKRKGRKVTITDSKTKAEVTAQVFSTVSICTFCDESYLLRPGAGDSEDMDDNCCGPCAADLIVADQEFHAAEAKKFGKRPCRSCGKPNSVGRYFSCEECLPAYRLPSEGVHDGLLPNMQGVTELTTILVARAAAANKGKSE